MSALEKIPCTILTGFLGAGKTTLLRHVLENANGRRLAIIVNEFGDVGIDGEILKGCGIESCKEDDVVELANGCICCTVADDFVPALEGLLNRDDRPEHILIETSGLALPKPLVKAFNWPAVRSRVTVDGVIAVVDAAAVASGRFAHDPEALAKQRAEDPSLDHDNPLEEVYEDQLLCADLIVLNKTDLVSSGDLDRVSGEVKEAVPRAVKIVRASSGNVDPAVLLGLGAGAEDDLDARPSHHDTEHEHDHDDFDSFVIDVPEMADPETLLQRLEGATRDHDVLRIKGFVPVKDKALRLLVQGVGARFQHHYDRPWRDNEARSGRLVIIGQKGIDQARITDAITG